MDKSKSGGLGAFMDKKPVTNFKYQSPMREKVGLGNHTIDRKSSPMGKGHKKVRKLNKNYHQKLFNFKKEEMRLFKQLIDVGIVPLHNVHVKEKVFQQVVFCCCKIQKMTGRDNSTNIIMPKERMDMCEKLNSYIPSYLHRKFPNLKKFEMEDHVVGMTKKRTNLISNPTINNGRCITNSIQMIKAKSQLLLPPSQVDHVSFFCGE